MDYTPPALTGFVKLHRSLLRFRWFRHRETLQVFVYLLLCASYRAMDAGGVSLAPGQAIAARRSIAEACGLTEWQVRTALDHLKSTGTIAIQPTSKCSVITLTGWEKYQGTGENAAGTPPAASPGKPPYRKNNHNNVSQEEKEKKGASFHGRNRHDDGSAQLYSGEYV